jgi:hypothetical protein
MQLYGAVLDALTGQGGGHLVAILAVAALVVARTAIDLASPRRDHQTPEDRP